MTKKFTSVTKLVNKYKEAFDTEKVAKRVAAKEGKSPEAIKAKWEAIADRGTSFHEKVETWFNNGTTKELKPNWLSKLERFKAMGVCHPEVKLRSEEYMVHGIADLMIEKPDGTWVVLDWKTNSKIWKTSYNSKVMKNPIGHLLDCNFVHYSLQIALYAELSGKEVSERYIVHIPKGTGEMEIIPALDLSDEAKTILRDV